MDGRDISQVPLGELDSDATETWSRDLPILSNHYSVDHTAIHHGPPGIRLHPLATLTSSSLLATSSM